MNSKKTLTTFLLFFAGIYSYAQSPFYFTGYGRALISSSAFDKGSEFIKNDTSSVKKKLDGQFLFDLGINIKPSEQFKASAILRVSNEFGGFYSTGSYLQFRQVQVQGLLAKKVLYNIGDIDLQLTKYTLFNFNEPTAAEFEADAFKIKRNIVEYDNFNFGNNWRLQGVQANTTVNFKKYLQSIYFSAFGTRVIPSDFLSTPDRLLFGGTMKVKQSKFVEIGGNVISISDITGTVQDTVTFYRNTVATGDFKASYSTRTINLSAFGEVGRSFYDLSIADNASSFKTQDGFFDVGANATHKYIPVSATVSYRLVGPEFYSPGAQTRRVFDDGSPVLLADGMSGTMTRGQTIFDRMSDLNLYNRSLSTTLMLYNPIYNNSTPYGFATPNRKGLTIDVKYGNKDSLLYASLNTQLLNEVLGTGISDKRKFMVLNGGATVNINKLLTWNKMLALSGGMRYEKTSGSDAINVDLTSMMIDGSLAVEVLKKFDLIGGLKYFSASGDEVLSVRNGFNQTINYEIFTADVTQSIYSGGFRYRFTNYIYFAANAFMSKSENKKFSSDNYQINQYFFSYIMRF